MSRCSTSKQATAKRQSLVTDLLKALTTSSGEPAPGTRNLLDQYTKLVHTCTPDFKNDWISQRGYSDLDMVKLFELDVARYQQQCLRAVAESSGNLGPDFEMYLPLFRSVPQEPYPEDPSIPESMAFSMRMFETAQQAGLVLKRGDWLDKIIHSLLNHILRGKPSQQFTQKILALVADCVRRYPSDSPLEPYASESDKKYWRNMVRLWQRNPKMYEPLLTPLLRAHNVRLHLERCPYNRSRDKATIQACMLTIERDLRYRFLRWTLLNHPGYRVDIDDEHQPKDNLKVLLSPRLLFMLPSAEALRLLDLFNAHASSPIKLDIGALGELGDEPRVELLRLYLMQDAAAVFKTAHERTVHSRQMAQDSGSQPIRSAWIKASVCFAVASQSLDLLQEIVLWARRFSRDPKTVIELYGSHPGGGHAFADGRTTALLSGMPGRFRGGGPTALEVTQNVRKGNEVMLDLLQSALQDMNVPAPKIRNIDPLAIDCMVVPLRSHGIRWPRLVQNAFGLKPIPTQRFWDLKPDNKKLKQVSQESREAFIAAALLIAGGRSQASSKILGRPFPSASETRFPAMFLDAELLDSKEPTDEDITAILTRFLPVVPPTLLKTLAESLVEKALREATSNVLRRWTTVVLGLLAMSDRPDLATDMIVQVVLGNPGETHWHRVLLHPGVLKRLSPEHAEGLMHRLAEGILDRLPAQGQAPAVIESGDVGEQAAVTPGPFTPSTSTVKVTTAKMLAQVLKNAAFVGDDFVINTLLSLFLKATHVHVRAAVVSGLASALYSSRSESTRNTIIEALATHVVPAAAEMNERSPMTETQWELAEKLCQPPQVYSDAGLAPICSALVDLVKAAPGSLRSSQNLVGRILLPLIKQSRDNNSRWTSVFLCKYDASDLASSLPKVPAKPKLLKILLENFPSCMPTSEFEILSDFIIYTNHPPQKLRDLAEQLKTDPQFYKQNDVQHWRNSTAPAPSSGCGTSHGILKVLKHGQFAPAEQTAAQNLITPAHLQAHEHKMLDHLLEDYSSNPTASTKCLDHYKPPLQNDERFVIEPLESRLRWRTYCSPILQYVISLIGTSRTPAWQQNPSRKQTILPETFPLRLSLLPYPTLYPASEQETSLAAFAEEIRALIEELASSRRPYHKQWKLLVDTVKQCKREEWVEVALRVGGVVDGHDNDDHQDNDDYQVKELSLAELLCVDAAEELLMAVKREAMGKGLQLLGVEVRELVEGMVEGWRGSGDEEVRRKGLGFGGMF